MEEMNDIIEALEQLLRIHRCVGIPQLGTFIVEDCEATMQKEEHWYKPPYKTVSFNQAQSTDDEQILLALLARKWSLSPMETRERVKNGLGMMLQTLRSKRELPMGKVGLLYLNERSELQFKCLVDDSFFPDYFGLHSFRCLEWRYLEQSALYPCANDRREEYIQIRIKRHYLHQLVTAAAVVLLFLLISKPVGEPMADYASLFSLLSTQQSRELLLTVTPPVEERVVETPSLAPLPIEEKSDLLPEQAVKPIEVVTAPVEQPLEQPVTTPVEQPKPQQAAVAERTYYIVIGSVTSTKEAQVLIDQQKHKGYTETATVAGNGRIRVYVRSFKDRKQADRFLQEYRADNPEHKDAWLLSLRK